MKTNSVLFNLSVIGTVAGSVYLANSSFGSPSTITTRRVTEKAPVAAVADESPFSYGRAFSQDYRLSGPYRTDNLAVYLLNAPKQAGTWSCITVHDALEQKKASVAETGNVNELRITNKSEQLVFVHSGDIVKGGRQDRMSQYDAIIGPKQTAPLAAFCVEQGRWQQRGSEASSSFAVPKPASLPASIPGYFKSRPALQGALNGSIGGMVSDARLKGDQSAVWSNVAKAQADLAVSTGKGVTDSRSDSSLELTLESPTMQEARLPYIRPLADLPDTKPASVGYIAFVDGKYVAGDSYANHEMFKAMWPKMLCVRATDAIVARKQPLVATQTDPFSLWKASLATTKVNGRTIQQTRTLGNLALFETVDHGSANKVVHTSIARNSK